MVIKNQNALYFLAWNSCCRQSLQMLDHENLSGAEARVFALRRKAMKQVVVRVVDELNDARTERCRPMAKAFPFHDLTLGRAIASPPWRERRIYC